TARVHHAARRRGCVAEAIEAIMAGAQTEGPAASRRRADLRGSMRILAAETIAFELRGRERRSSGVVPDLSTVFAHDACPRLQIGNVTRSSEVDIGSDAPLPFWVFGAVALGKNCAGSGEVKIVALTFAGSEAAPSDPRCVLTTGESPIIPDSSASG